MTSHFADVAGEIIISLSMTPTVRSVVDHSVAPSGVLEVSIDMTTSLDEGLGEGTSGTAVTGTGALVAGVPLAVEPDAALALSIDVTEVESWTTTVTGNDVEPWEDQMQRTAGALPPDPSPGEVPGEPYRDGRRTRST